MSEIMSLFIFQASRRQVVAQLQRNFDATSEDRSDRSKQDNETDDAAKRRFDGLRRAVTAADDQVRRLEYWSDVKDMVQKGETKGGVDAAQGWGPGWQGVDASGPAGQHVKVGP